MANHLNKPFHFTILFLGLLLSPFLGFSQQEEPKRVSVVVTAKEITPQKEVVQIPADNTPKVAIKSTTPKAVAKNPQTAAKKVVAPVKSISPKEQPLTAAPIVAKKEPAKKQTVVPPKTTAVPNKIKTEEIAKSKPAEIKKEKPKEIVSAEQSVTATPKKETKAQEVTPNKAPVQVNDKTAANIVKADNENKEVVEIPNNVKANSSSYIWIGIFLIVAGVVLGLLFGKPAFLISFVGVVFVALGMII
ncbi:hypothetical protein [Pedobacter xixiisoli]|uniref:Uncharacterized protein n=1 Tax=Pedobacter xixiisoli TaxID=1476464 RepID=A0A286A6C9_9SPHI|nr:hypothetical protein [Pedobacter xixiisoli]SOD17456.1 hypothetical protein SAMN06297358_2541 [Pedobacter xixiisoli]